MTSPKEAAGEARTPPERRSLAVRSDRRLRLAAVERERVGEFACHARATLEGPDGVQCEGQAELPWNAQNYLRVACEATLVALNGLLAGGGAFRLVGLRSLRIFDHPVVAVQVAWREGEREKLLLGIAVASGDTALGAARAVLHATNRLIGNVVDR